MYNTHAFERESLKGAIETSQSVRTDKALAPIDANDALNATVSIPQTSIPADIRQTSSNPEHSNRGAAMYPGQDNRSKDNNSIECSEQEPTSNTENDAKNRGSEDPAHDAYHQSYSAVHTDTKADFFRQFHEMSIQAIVRAYSMHDRQYVTVSASERMTVKVQWANHDHARTHNGEFEELAVWNATRLRQVCPNMADLSKYIVEFAKPDKGQRRQLNYLYKQWVAAGRPEQTPWRY